MNKINYKIEKTRRSRRNRKMLDELRPRFWVDVNEVNVSWKLMSYKKLENLPQEKYDQNDMSVVNKN